MKQRLLVLFGGASAEHEVSCLSAASVLRHLDENKYEIYKAGITKEGNWFLTDSPVSDVEDGSWKKNPANKKAFLSPDTEVGGLVVLEKDKYEVLPLDVVFPVLHGKNGEDGTVQGLLDLSGIPYVGSGTAASAASMDKAITKMIVCQTGVRQADFYLTDRYTFASDPQGILKEAEDHFGGAYPLFVKPANAGSSVGISKAKNSRELFDAIRIAAEEDHKVLIEEAIVGREIEVAVLGNRHPNASRVGEILAANEFYDYDAKYINNQSKTRILDDVSEEKEEEIRQAALTVYKAMGCEGLARVDFFLSKTEQVVFNEINTLPGFTNISMYPKLWEAAGLPYKELLDKLIALATEEME
ncbi:D-alanine--D-alanine ligase [Anaerovorax odorimutans]|uniref:D-alanine--D-alanine ligase n=1 Tax=Anaerovorax odorimutans TaxID=109327 RepID=A0ABT1RJA3_9FIRM|nr:D-alanine--D-alanine ligase family protein [Anaerovorax odorimutans]MCQ4635250.1 D-alanine--D-alanine ligase [Anaerovorax odorimutans]